MQTLFQNELNIYSTYNALKILDTKVYHMESTKKICMNVRKKEIRGHKIINNR